MLCCFQGFIDRVTLTGNASPLVKCPGNKISSMCFVNTVLVALSCHTGSDVFLFMRERRNVYRDFDQLQKPKQQMDISKAESRKCVIVTS